MRHHLNHLATVQCSDCQENDTQKCSLPAQDFRELVQKGSYCFVEAAAPKDPLEMDGSKSCLYSSPNRPLRLEPSDVLNVWRVVSLLWL